MDTSPGSTSIRFAVLVVAFLVHTASWAGFCALVIAAGSTYSGGEVEIGLVLLVLALLAAASALVIARLQPNVAGSVFAALVVVVCCAAGVGQLLSRLVAESNRSAVGEVISGLPFVAAVILPVLVARATILSVREIADLERSAPSPVAEATGSSPSRNTAGIILLATAVIVVALMCTAAMSDIYALPVSFLTLALFLPIIAAVGGVSALFAARRTLSAPISPRRGAIVRGAASISVAGSMLLVTLGSALQVDPETAMVGDGALFGFAVVSYIASVTVLAIAGLAAPRRPWTRFVAASSGSAAA